MAGTDTAKAFSAIFIGANSTSYDFNFALRNEIFHVATARLVPRSTIFYDAKKFFIS